MRLYGERDGGEQEQKFQSTHPLRGATGIAADETNRIENFNPRTPCGVRLLLKNAPAADVVISIHAPLAGCDRPFPGGRRWSVPISIHAPLAGCDEVTKAVHL